MAETRRTFLKKVAIGAPALALSPWSRLGASEDPPNILFIMSDDHAQNAISAYSRRLVQTPNIDRIGREGVVFENAFVTNSLCAPSRAVILTGKYSHMNGLRDNTEHFDPKQPTFPQMLQKVGYQTYMIGKWHLKTKPVGFDFWKILPGQGQYYNPEFLDASGRKQYTGYVTDLITDFALQALDKRDKSRPFMMMVQHKAPHRNWMPSLKHLSAFDGHKFPLPETFFDDYSTRCPAAKRADMRVEDLWLSFDLKLTPEFFDVDAGTGGNQKSDPVPMWEATLKRLTPKQRKAWEAHYRPIGEAFRRAKLKGKDLLLWKYQRYMQDYLSCVLSVDESVGTLLRYLDDNGLAKNTLVVYTSDQGFFLGEHGWFDKRFMYEESMGTPILVRYPAAVPAGQRRRELVLNLDFAPTFLDFAGVKVPEDMQGASLRPLLQGKPNPPWRDGVYYHYYEGYPYSWHRVQRHFGIRTDRFKLIYFYGCECGGCWELYDLKKDPNELHNLYGDPAYRDVVTTLKRHLARLQSQLGDHEAARLW